MRCARHRHAYGCQGQKLPTHGHRRDAARSRICLNTPQAPSTGVAQNAPARSPKAAGHGGAETAETSGERQNTLSLYLCAVIPARPCTL